MNDVKLLRDSLGGLFTEFSDGEAIRSATGEWPVALWDALESADMTGIGFEVATASSEATWEHVGTLIEVAGYFGSPVPLAEHILAGYVLGHHGVHPQPGVLTIGSGRLVSDGVLTVSRVPWGRVATMCIVDGASARSDGLVIIERERSACADGVNLAGEPRDTLTASSGWTDLAASSVDTLPVTAIAAALRCAAMSGAARRIRDLTHTYVKDRSQFGRPIYKFQAVANRFADMAAQVATLEAAAAVAVDGLTRGSLSRLAQARAVASELAGEIAASAHQLHGAIGICAEYDLQLFTRRLWAWRDEFGTERFWKTWVGDRVRDELMVSPWEAVSTLKLDAPPLGSRPRS